MHSKKLPIAIVTSLLIIYASTASTAQAARVQLSWDAPTTNEDGTPLTDLAGYKVYYGQASRQYDVSVDVGLSTTAALSSLVDGRAYYFAVTAYDTSGNESNFSTEIVYATASAYTSPAAPVLGLPVGALSVKWRAPAGRPPNDWIGLYRTGAANTNYLWSIHTGGARNGTATLAAPTKTGTYVFRYLLEDGFSSRCTE